MITSSESKYDLHGRSKSVQNRGQKDVFFQNISRTVTLMFLDFRYVIEDVEAEFRLYYMFNKICNLRGQNRDQRLFQ